MANPLLIAYVQLLESVKAVQKQLTNHNYSSASQTLGEMRNHLYVTLRNMFTKWKIVFEPETSITQEQFNLLSYEQLTTCYEKFLSMLFIQQHLYLYNYCKVILNIVRLYTYYHEYLSYRDHFALHDMKIDVDINSSARHKTLMIDYLDSLKATSVSPQ